MINKIAVGSILGAVGLILGLTLGLHAVADLIELTMPVSAESLGVHAQVINHNLQVTEQQSEPGELQRTKDYSLLQPARTAQSYTPTYNPQVTGGKLQ